jgi:hypothetical protein
MSYFLRSIVALALCVSLLPSAVRADSDGPLSGLTSFFNSRPVNQINSTIIAQDTSEGIRVNLRVISGIGSDEEGASMPAQIDDRIKDLTIKLRQLHFREFKLVSEQDKIVPMAKKQAVTIGNGETLTVRPVYVDKHRVGMWLRWQDRDGKQILDTRMHFNCGEPMLAGTDRSSGASTILAITVHPQ